MVEVLRVGHRIFRDRRIATHVGLVSRAFGASKIYYFGQKDSGLERSMDKVVSEFGGKFSIEYVKSYKKLIIDKKKDGFKIVHLTMYGEDFLDAIPSIKKDKVFFIVGGEKVPGDIFELSDYNVSVSSQPHSEVAALAISLYEYFGNSILGKKFKDANLNIIPQKRGKRINSK